MKANELRIGVTFNYFGKPKTIYNYTELLSCFSSNGIIEVGIEPIPLTEEILLKCGFIHAPSLEDNAFIKEVQLWERETIIRIDHFNVNDRWRFVFSICQLENEYLYDGNKLKDLKTEEIEKEIPIKEFEYLHDLQNIFHALTNEELQIEL